MSGPNELRVIKWLLLNNANAAIIRLTSSHFFHSVVLTDVPRFVIQLHIIVKLQCAKNATLMDREI